MIGKTLGKVHILAEIGQGGMATVYKGEHTILNKLVAVKILSKSIGLTNGESVERFRNEAKALARLDHPNIVVLYDFGEEQGIHYIVTQYVEGPTLKEKVTNEGALPVMESVRVVREVLRALDYAHSEGIIHRDIKPSNIMFDRQGNVKITDFGLVKFLDTSQQLTLTGEGVGTPYYMSPEQWDGEKASPQMDIWSLGVTWYYSLTTHVPFPGDKPTSVLKSIMNRPIPAMAEYGIHVPPALENILRRMLEKDPKYRYRNARSVLKDLNKITMVLGTPAMGEIKEEEEKLEITTTHIGMSYKTKLKIGIAILLIFILGAIGYVAYQYQQKHGFSISHSSKSFKDEIWFQDLIQQEPTLLIEQLVYQIPGKDQWILDMSAKAWLKLPLVRQAQLAASYQKAYAKQLHTSVEKKFWLGKKVFFYLVLIPPGRFWMGAPLTEKERSKNEKRHRVVISQAFWMSKYEITQAQWTAVTGKRPWFKKKYVKNHPYYAASYISWNDIKEKFLTRLRGNFFLPTEAQWEYACRAGSTKRFFWGDDPNSTIIRRYAVYKKTKVGNYAHKIGSKKANAWGLYDMTGNVWEWCEDWYGDYPKEEQIDPAGPGVGEYRVKRGGCWFHGAICCRSAYRSRSKPSSVGGHVGFRICTSVFNKTK